jgi:hypothetical protein
VASTARFHDHFDFVDGAALLGQRVLHFHSGSRAAYSSVRGLVEVVEYDVRKAQDWRSAAPRVRAQVLAVLVASDQQQQQQRVALHLVLADFLERHQE